MTWRLRKAYPISMFLFITAIVYALVTFVVPPLDNNTGLAIAGFVLIISGEMAYFLRRYNVTVNGDELRVNQRVYHAQELKEITIFPDRIEYKLGIQLKNSKSISFRVSPDIAEEFLKCAQNWSDTYDVRVQAHWT